MKPFARSMPRPGRLLGEFMADDRIVVFLSSGEYAFTGFDLNTRFDDKMIHLEKWHPQRPVSVVYYEGEKEDWYVKRFTQNLSRRLSLSSAITKTHAWVSCPLPTIRSCASGSTAVSKKPGPRR